MIEFLLARIAEDEMRASKLLERAQKVQAQLHDNPKLVLGRFIPGWNDWPDVETLASRAIAECEAKRVIVTIHQPYDGTQMCGGCDGVNDIDECPELAAFAKIYEGHPDFLPEWLLL